MSKNNSNKTLGLVATFAQEIGVELQVVQASLGADEDRALVAMSLIKEGLRASERDDRMGLLWEAQRCLGL